MQPAEADARKIRRFFTLVVALTLLACAPFLVVWLSYWHHYSCDRMYQIGGWSGQRIYYFVGRYDGNYDYDDSEIHSINADGSNDQLLVSGAHDPALSPDGARLVFMATQDYGSRGPDAGVLDLATGVVSAIEDMGIYTASWSPDSRWIVYDPYDGPVTKQDVISGEIVTFDQPDSGSSLLWSPDGSQIVYASESLYLLNPASGDITPLNNARPSCNYNYPEAWRPDGGALAYRELCGYHGQIRFITVDGVQIAALNDLFEQNWSWGWWAEWSRDGQRILVSDGSQLYVVNNDGSGLQELRRGVSQAQWSPDGSQIVFEGRDWAGASQLYVMAADPDEFGSNTIQLTSSPWELVCLD
jgi:Tol biopolymer transport system component